MVLLTEKRFTTKSQDDYFGVIDNNVGDNVCVVNGIHTLIEAEWLCEVLNSLINENEQLKGELRNLRRLANQLYMEGSE